MVLRFSKLRPLELSTAGKPLLWAEEETLPEATLRRPTRTTLILRTPSTPPSSASRTLSRDNSLNVILKSESSSLLIRIKLSDNLLTTRLSISSRKLNEKRV